MDNSILRTVLGDIPIEDVGIILPHEHLFTDLRGPNVIDYAQADPIIVTRTLLPYLDAAHEAGVTALVECSTNGVGRNLEILQHIARHTPIHIVAPTGVYKEGFIPTSLLNSTVDELVQLWTHEINQSINGSTSKAGFIKIAVSDEGPTWLEERNIRAAAQTSLATGAVIASHTIGGKAALEELAFLRMEGLSLEKFIWVHADSEPDLNIHLELMNLGGYIEFDFIGQPNQDPHAHVEKLLYLLEHTNGDRILLSHDAGWFQPGSPNGIPEGGIRGYTYLADEFIPLMMRYGLTQENVKLLIETNPKRAFALSK